MEFSSRMLIIYLKHSVTGNTEEFNVKTSENMFKYGNSNMWEMVISREMFSREGDNSSRFEGKTVAGEHTILH